MSYSNMPAEDVEGLLREEAAFKLHLRDMTDEEIKLGLATRRWIDFADRSHLSWREVIARTELERRQRRDRNHDAVELLQEEVDLLQKRLRRARTNFNIACGIAAVGLLTPVGTLLGGSLVQFLGDLIALLAGYFEAMKGGLV